MLASYPGSWLAGRKRASSINHHYTGGHVLVQHKKTEHKTIQSGMKSLMRVFCSSIVVLSAMATKEATHPTMTGRPP